MQRRFVTVERRQVHYRRLGSGPAALLLHESPLSSRVLVPLAGELARRGFTAIALDTPGYGQSDPLAGTGRAGGGVPPSPDAPSGCAPSAADYARATIEAIEALRIPRCLLYGAHTGAQIALAAALLRPDLLTAVIAEGPPVLTEEEREQLLARYCPPLEPAWDGSHLLAGWAMRRDQAIFWPWYRHERAHRRSADMLPAQVIHDGLVDTLRAGPGYGLGYGAAYAFDTASALVALGGGSTGPGTGPLPVHLVCTEGIFLADQLQRLPPLGPAVHVELLAEKRAAALVRLGELAEQHRPEPAAPPPPPSLHVAGRVTREVAQTFFGQVLVRRATELPGRPLVLLHASPGSAAELEPLMLALAPQRPVIALDTLGHGDSDPPPWEDATVDDYAKVVVAAIDRLGIADFDLFGAYTGAEIAIATAIGASHRVRSLVLSNVNLLPQPLREELHRRYAVPVVPRDDGGHLLDAWARLQDSVAFFPWFLRTREAIRWQEPPPLERLHALFVEQLKGGSTHHIATRAGLLHDTAASLRRVQARTLVLSSLGDPLHACSEEAAALLPHGEAYTLPGSLEETAAVIEQFLRGTSPGVPAGSVQAEE